MSEQNNLTRSEIEAKIITKAWQDETFKQELLNKPEAVLSQEVGHSIPEGVEIQILEETPGTIYMVLPMKPAIAEEGELTPEQLESVAGGGFWGDFWDGFKHTITKGFKGCGTALKDGEIPD